MDADIAQSVVIERQQFLQHPPVRGARPGASPPQRERPHDLVDDPRFATDYISPRANFAAAEVCPRGGGPESTRSFGVFNLHSKISFTFSKVQTDLGVFFRRGVPVTKLCRYRRETCNILRGNGLGRGR
jgi:hypothetical protein